MWPGPGGIQIACFPCPATAPCQINYFPPFCCESYFMTPIAAPISATTTPSTQPATVPARPR